MFAKIAVLAAGLLLCGPMLTQARATVLVGDQYVDYTDLHIETNTGANRLLRRMGLAANAFCILAPVQRACRHETMALAVASLHSSALSARHLWTGPAAPAPE
jgi:UrcA family protein